MTFHDWSWVSEEPLSEHKLVLKKTEELAVRKYIYDSIGKR
ncbi:hypothetical protein F8205_gp229, partial [Paramecium bursaria Chlorella virus CVA-1]